jgi:hypothetical protein
MAVPTFTLPYFGTPPYYSGTAVSALVPAVFPVAIDGRPFMVDQKSGKFQRGYEQRVRDSTDDSTTPGEGAINPGGLWRRGQDSWHAGAGQTYADMNDSAPYRFYKSKGVNPWVKGQLSLLNDTKVSLSNASTTQHMVVCGTRVYATFNGDVKYTDNPYGIKATITGVSASAGTITYTTLAAHGYTAGQKVDITGVAPIAYNLSNATLATASGTSFTITNAATGAFVSGGTAVQRPIWTDCTGEPASNVQSMATDGNDIYIVFVSDGVRKIDTSVDPSVVDATKFVTGTDNFYLIGFAKNYMFGAYSHVLRLIPASGTPLTAAITPDDTTFTWVGLATGQNAVYAAGFSGKKSLIYKITIKADGTLDAGVVALQLPTGEVVTTISAYLGFVLIGTNKGVRYCSTDADANLIAGKLIPTSGAVQKFASNERFSYFTWTNYDGVSSGLGALDLSVFTSPNTPAFATDLMYTPAVAATPATVNSVVVFDDPVTPFATKKLFAISGIGIIAEDADNLVASGEIESGTWRWGIPDRKFVAKIDTRSTPLVGAITSYLKIDDGEYESVGRWSVADDTENSFDGSESKAIEADFRFVLERGTATTGPTFTRWMARAYAAPFRSQVFSIPIILHKSVTVRGKEYYYDVDEQQTFFDGLIESPRIIALQIGSFTHNVILEDIVWEPADSVGNSWAFEGTLVVTLRSVEN